MNISFEGKAALVTGAASGLGLATAKAFAESGASVALADWNGDAAKAAADDLVRAGHKAIGNRCDVADDAQVEAMVAETVKAFGRLDAAYNNAGVQNVLAETADTTREDYDRVMSINLRGEWSCMKFELQHMRKRGSGAIVNCSSLGGLVGGAERGSRDHLKSRIESELTAQSVSVGYGVLVERGVGFTGKDGPMRSIVSGDSASCPNSYAARAADRRRGSLSGRGMDRAISRLT